MKATAPDKGAGNTKIHVFVQASTEDEARKILSTVDAYNVYDFSEAKISDKTYSLWDDVAMMMKRAGGPNEAVNMNGERITRSDLD